MPSTKKLQGPLGQYGIARSLVQTPGWKPLEGLTQLGEMFSNIAAKKTSTESDQGGK